MRRALAPAIAAAILVTAALLPGGVDAASLKRHVVLNGTDLTLGDLFDGAGTYAGKVVGRAPDPGQRYTLEARWLGYVARAYNLQWQPLTDDDRAVVERASQVVGAAEIKAYVLRALEPQLPTVDRYGVDLDPRTEQLHLPTNVPPTLKVAQVNHDKLSQRFSAVLAASDDGPGTHRYTITGKLYRMVEVPVLTRRVRRGDVIDEDDVKTITMRAAKLGPNVLTATEELAGKSPKRTLIEHRPVSASDVQDPILVKRNGLVTMIYQTRFMRISARGIAKQDGSEGETVRVENSGSKKIVRGVVTGSSEVTVVPSSPVALK